MCAPESTREKHPEIESYLQQLARAAPTSTYISHKTTLQTFTEWYSHDTVSSELSAELIAAYAIELQADYSPTTIKGHIDSLANYLCYLRRREPTLVKTQVANILKHDFCKNCKTLTELLYPSQPAGITQEDVENVLNYLRQCKFGTRDHAFTEVLVDTKAKPSLVRDTNISDFDRESGKLKIDIAKEHAVSNAELVTTRTVTLSEPTVDALTNFIEFERTSPNTENSSPLFTTSSGRVSESTLRRDIKSASDSAHTFFGESSSRGENDRQVTPSDVWWYAVTNNGDEG